MSNLNEVVNKIRDERSSNSQYNSNGQVVDQRRRELKTRLPFLEEGSLNAAAIFLQYTDITRFTDNELLIIAESGLEDMEYCGQITQIEKVLDPDNPSFDVEGMLFNDNLQYTNLRKSYRRALASHKSLTGSFQSTFLSSI